MSTPPCVHDACLCLPTHTTSLEAATRQEPLERCALPGTLPGTLWPTPSPASSSAHASSLHATPNPSPSLAPALSRPSFCPSRTNVTTVTPPPAPRAIVTAPTAAAVPLRRSRSHDRAPGVPALRRAGLQRVPPSAPSASTPLMRHASSETSQAEGLPGGDSKPSHKSPRSTASRACLCDDAWESPTTSSPPCRGTQEASSYTDAA